MTSDAGVAMPRRLFLPTDPDMPRARIARILTLAGWDVAAGSPPHGAYGARWARPDAVAQPRRLLIDAAPLRLRPEGDGCQISGLVIDHLGAPFGSGLTGLVRLLQNQPLTQGKLEERAETAVQRMRAAHLSQIGAARPEIPAPAEGAVVLLETPTTTPEQRRQLIEAAQARYPGRPLVVHGAAQRVAGTVCCPADLSPWVLFDAAEAVFTVDAPLGFEAILAGHRPHVLGRPFYAGLGLTEDHLTLSRRVRDLSVAQLAAGVLIRAPLWYDPHHDRLCEIETVLDQLEARARAWRDDHRGWVISGAGPWKRPHLKTFFGSYRTMRFARSPEAAQRIAQRTGRRQMVWASKQAAPGAVGLEDGFVRSRGLGAALIPPLSLALDDMGIHFDPAQPSRLEHLIATGTRLRSDQFLRARNLIERLRRDGITKYNLDGSVPPLPPGHKILVVGQVEDDASVRLGAPGLGNLHLLQRARAENPDAVILYKPHPDVEAGLRRGAIKDADRWADLVLSNAPMAPLLLQVNALWTLTSLAGFEALLRGREVVTLGAPFYAGWGLTRDLGAVPQRRREGPRPSLEALVHAALIDYPRYVDPVTRTTCPVEVVLDRLEMRGRLPMSGPLMRIASGLRLYLGASPRLRRLLRSF